MTTNTIKLLLAISLCFGGILILERVMLDSEEAFSKTVVEPAESSIFNETLPDIKFPDKTQEMYSDMVERPLFIDGRRPVIEENDGSSTNEVVGKIEDVALMGVYTQEEQLMALVSVQGDNEKYVKMNVGDEISGWLLQKIGNDRIVFERDGTEETLLLRKPKPAKKEKKNLRKRESPFQKAMKQDKSPAAQKNQDEKREQNEK